MPELDGFYTFLTLEKTHIPTYHYADNTHRNDLCGSWAGSFLSYDIILF